jgi:hypothetical protein
LDKTQLTKLTRELQTICLNKSIEKRIQIYYFLFEIFLKEIRQKLIYKTDLRFDNRGLDDHEIFNAALLFGKLEILSGPWQSQK